MQTNFKLRFLADGFIAPVRVLSADETIYYRNRYEDYVRRYGSTGDEGGPRRIRGNRLFRLHVLASWAARLVRHPALLKAVSEVCLTVCP